MTLEWRECVDVLAHPEEPTAYWELVAAGSDEFFARQYATIHKVKDRVWYLRRWEHNLVTRDVREVCTYHRTLKEAKALGLIEVRFNLALGIN